MAFTIPNEADAFHAHQSEVDKVDLDILAQGFQGNGVISGLDIIQDTGSNMNVKTNTAGTAIVSGVVRKLAANVTATIGTAHGTHPRFDLVCITDSDTLVVVAGTAAAAPVFPAIPADRTVLAAVYVPANDTAITTAQVIDKRVIVLGRQPLVINRDDAVAGPNNSSSEVSLYTYTVKANLLGSTRGLRCQIQGTFLLNSGTPTVTIRIKFGATTLFAEVSPAHATDADEAAFEISFLLVNTATNAQKLGGYIHQGSRVAATTGFGDLTTLDGAAGNIGVSDPIYGVAGTLDTTSDQTLDVTAQLNVTNSLDRFEKRIAVLELLP